MPQKSRARDAVVLLALMICRNGQDNKAGCQHRSCYFCQDSAYHEAVCCPQTTILLELGTEDEFTRAVLFHVAPLAGPSVESGWLSVSCSFPFL